MITTLLVANRGEIACRVMRTAKAMGLTTVAVHSAIDRDARHAREADIRVDLGGAKPADSYLLIDKLIAAAKASGAQAIHPGYGFLSENADFARAIEDAGLIFLGPPASAIDAMGSKSAAKALMEKAGVPLVPGYHGEAQDVETFRIAAEKIGYPVLLKATAGGGGKGMKVVEREADLAEALQSAQREAQSSFGDSRMLVEKYVLKPRHVEIQVFADQHGNCLYLNERDCSIQRRHQKVVEEAPAPGLSAELRRAMGEAAVKAAQAIGYVGAGTVEFLLDARGEFFFMEMNTRLQVEHPVTEEITGVDLVEWQLLVASGQPIPIKQEDLFIDGHSIEARLYAEDPSSGFLPSTGPLEHFDLGVEGRIETGVEEGDKISPFYDPMVAKLVVWGETRGEAIDQLAEITERVEIWPVKTNAAFIANCLREDDFEDAKLDTDFIASKMDRLVSSDTADDAVWQSAVDFIALAESEEHGDLPVGLRLNAPGVLATTLHHKGETRTVAAAQGGDDVTMTGFVDPARAVVFADGQSFVFDRQSRGSGAAAAGDGAILAPMPGKVITVDVAEGESVTAGQRLMVLEAMKMEHALTAPFDGTVTELSASEGGQVQVEAVLAVVEPNAE